MGQKLSNLAYGRAIFSCLDFVSPEANYHHNFDPAHQITKLDTNFIPLFVLPELA